MLRARGVPWRHIAQRDGASLSTVQRGVQAHLETVDAAKGQAQQLLDAAATGTPDVPELAVPETPADLDPQALYMTVIRSILESMEELEHLSVTSDHAGARVGAAKGRLQAARELSHALALVGLLPNPDRVLLARMETVAARREARARGELLAGAMR